ncbi:murein hydrolase activator EnvC [Agaribacterium sp. ZY112]|uniref:murein hydrolase activator EnvC family protein n=1 Tax=Agaribacterium sp. ZY112 TaxID=3233574 RepID=UPI0035246E2C
MLNQSKGLFDLKPRLPRGFKANLLPVAGLLLSICSITLASHSHANSSTTNSAEQQAKFEEVKRSIEELKRSLEQTKSSRSELESELEKNEKTIQKLNNKTNDLKQELDEKQSTLNELKTEQASLNKKKSEQSLLVKDYVNAAYRLDQKSELQLLLNQQDPSQVQRMLKYYQSFSASRNELISRFASTLSRLQELEPAIAAETEQLQTTYQALQQERKNLRANQKQRQQTLSKLAKQYQNQQQRLDGLKEDQRRLETLLSHVYEEINAQELNASISNFAQLRGKLPKPAKGKALNRFGKNRSGSQLKWQGIEFAAAHGSDVIAVHHGQVVFSDYLRGHGLLLIIDHGDGYMSLYAHADTLFKEIGEWVESGETIARVGNTGGRSNSALYFELRHNGKPTNPSAWLKRA